MITITGDCSMCGEPVTIVDGVWPPGHGFGKCGSWPPSLAPAVKGETIEVPIDELFEELE